MSGVPGNFGNANLQPQSPSIGLFGGTSAQVTRPAPVRDVTSGGLAAAARGVGAVSDLGMRRAIIKQEEQNDIDALAAYSQYQEGIFNLLHGDEGIYNRSSSNARTSLDDYTRAEKELRTTILEDGGYNHAVVKRFNMAAEKDFQRERIKVAGHEVNQHQVEKVLKSHRQVEVAVNDSVRNFRGVEEDGTSTLDNNIQIIKDAINERVDLAPEQKEALIEQTLSNLHLEISEQISRTNASEAIRYLDAKLAKNEIDPKQADDIRKVLQGMDGDRQAEAFVINMKRMGVDFAEGINRIDSNLDPDIQARARTLWRKALSDERTAEAIAVDDALGVANLMIFDPEKKQDVERDLPLHLRKILIENGKWPDIIDLNRAARAGQPIEKDAFLYADLTILSETKGEISERDLETKFLPMFKDGTTLDDLVGINGQQLFKRLVKQGGPRSLNIIRPHLEKDEFNALQKTLVDITVGNDPVDTDMDRAITEAMFSFGVTTNDRTNQTDDWNEFRTQHMPDFLRDVRAAQKRKGEDKLDELELFEIAESHTQRVQRRKPGSKKIEEIPLHDFDVDGTTQEPRIARIIQRFRAESDLERLEVISGEAIEDFANAIITEANERRLDLDSWTDDDIVEFLRRTIEHIPGVNAESPGEPRVGGVASSTIEFLNRNVDPDQAQDLVRNPFI